MTGPWGGATMTEAEWHDGGGGVSWRSWGTSMTETEWLAGDDPRTMLGFLEGRTTGRKLRLFNYACLRSVAHLLTERGRQVVEVAGRHADGECDPEELDRVRTEGRSVLASSLEPLSAHRSAAEA